MKTESLIGIDFSACTDIAAKLNEKNEILDRTIGKYMCSISRGKDDEIVEKTYEVIEGELKDLIENIVHKNHPRYEGLNNKLLKRGL